jgi:hypothetical protein
MHALDAPQPVDPFWPVDDFDDDDEPEFPQEFDDEWPLEFDAEHWDFLVPDDDYEPAPEYGDFWPERSAMPRPPMNGRPANASA